MLTMSDGLISAIEYDYEKNEVMGFTENDNILSLIHISEPTRPY